MPRTMFSGPRIGLSLLLAGYAVLLFIRIGAVAGGSDNSGYFNEARLLSRGGIHADQRVLATLPAAETPRWLYVPLGFQPRPDGWDASYTLPNVLRPPMAEAKPEPRPDLRAEPRVEAMLRA